MLTRPFVHRRVVPLLLAVCVMALMGLAGLAGRTVLAASPPLGVDDVVALLDAGVGESLILRQIASTGTRLTLTTGELLRLKRAGASDRLIGVLMDDASADTPEPPAGLRVFTEITASGERVVHVTNLDESGNRIGGEVPRPAPRNVVAESPRPDREESSFDERYPATQVYVEVYPPASPPPQPDTPIGYGVSGPGFPGGVYPGYYPGYYPGLRRRGSGHRGQVFPTWSPDSPPGSYSQFERYHHDQTAPYRAGTAATRNRMRFRRN